MADQETTPGNLDVEERRSSTDLLCIKRKVLPVTVLVEMQLYDLDGDGWAWVAPLEQKNSATGVNVKLERVHKHNA